MKTIKVKGFTIIELMIVVAILGVLASIGFAAYQFYLIQTKNAEVSQMFSAIAKGEISFYLTPRRAINGDALNSCYLAAVRTPLQAVGINKVQWDDPSVLPGVVSTFKAMDIASSSPVYYGYQVSAVGNNPVGLGGFCVSPVDTPTIAVPNSSIALVSAIGDLDGDSQLSVLGALSPPIYAAVGGCSSTSVGTPGVFNPPCGTFISMFVMNLGVDGTGVPTKGAMAVSTVLP